MISPEGVPLHISVASAGSRAGALILDLLIILGLMVAATLLGLLIHSTLSADTQNQLDGKNGARDLVIIIYLIMMFLFHNAYFLYFELSPRAATWGKRAVGIRVAARDGGRLTANAIIARNLIRDIEIFLPLIFLTAGAAEDGLSGLAVWAGRIWFMIFLLLPLLNKDRLRAGDLIAGTWVIDNVKPVLSGVVAPAATAPADGTHQPAAYQFSDEELSVYGEYELQTLERVLRTGSEAAMKTVSASICAKIGWEPGSGDERRFLEAYYTALRGRLERGMRFGKRRKDKYSDAI